MSHASPNPETLTEKGGLGLLVALGYLAASIATIVGIYREAVGGDGTAEIAGGVTVAILTSIGAVALRPRDQ